MTFEELQQVVADIEHQGWKFVVSEIGEGFFLQVQFLAPDTDDPCGLTFSMQHGRKWYVSSFSTCSEVVQTALKAVLAAVEHEAREHFRYRGAPIFRPHHDVHRLWFLTTCHEPDGRAEQ